MGSTTSRELTEKERAFVEFFVGAAQGNATEAARMAKYANPDANGARVMARDGVRQAILDARKPTTLRRIMDKERRQELLSTIAESTTEETKDRIKAIEVLGRMQGDFIEKHEVEVTGKPVVVRFSGRGT